jgi:peptide/nickel transport system permease protein
MKNTAEKTPPAAIKKKSQWRSVWIRYRKNAPAMLGLFMLIFLLVLSGSAGMWLDYDAKVVEQNMKARLLPPGEGHIFGTDQFGRDVFARVVFGARISILVGLTTIALALAIGSVIGSVAGFYGGRTGTFLMRCMDVLLSIPAILLAISIVAALGNGLVNLIIALTVSSVPRFAYIVRSTVLTIKDQEFVEAARAYGSSNARIIFRHILPNVIGIIIVQATTNMASTILLISSLSFVGLGLSSSIPEWGSMLSAAKQYMRHNPYLIFFPGIAIVIAVMALNLMGDGLRDAVDPKLKN